MGMACNGNEHVQCSWLAGKNCVLPGLRWGRYITSGVLTSVRVPTTILSSSLVSGIALLSSTCTAIVTSPGTVPAMRLSPNLVGKRKSRTLPAAPAVKVYPSMPWISCPTQPRGRRTPCIVRAVSGDGLFRMRIRIVKVLFGGSQAVEETPVLNMSKVREAVSPSAMMPPETDTGGAATILTLDCCGQRNVKVLECA